MMRLFLLLLLVLFPRISSASSTEQGKNNGIISFTPDKFVSSAPLVVAAACRDGIAIVATHKGLLLTDEETRNNSTTSTNISTAENNKDNTMESHHLPQSNLNYHGPLRIYQVDQFGTSLVCAGWRTDGNSLASVLRKLAASELELYGAPHEMLEYGRFLATQAALYLASCVVSDSVRPLSCVGLLCSAGGLWLVDAFGAFRVRAHALGKRSEDVNEALLHTDFSQQTKEEAVTTLLRLVHDDDKAQCEVAVVDSAAKSLKRLPFGIVKTTTT